MEKIMILTDKQIEELKNSFEPELKFSKVTGIKLEANYDIGDTAVSIDNIEQNGVYKSHFANKITYYVVLKAMDINLGFAYSFYPVN